MYSFIFQEPRLRSHYIDLWFTVYGSAVPALLKPQEKVSEEKPSPRNTHITNISNGVEDLLSLWSWHGTVVEIDELDSSVERLANEMNDDDTLQ